MKRVFLYIAIVFVGMGFFAHSVGAQVSKARFSHITTEDGLPQNMVDCMLQDSHGFFWFGTWNGLCRYDGYSFDVFNDKSPDGYHLNDIFIYSLHEDPYGNIWIGTRQGLYVYLYDLQRFVLIDKNPDKIKTDDAYHTITQFGKNRILIGSNSGIVALKITDNSGNYEIVRHLTLADSKNGLSGTIVNAILYDSQREVWIGTDNGLFRLNDAFEVKNKYTNGLPGKNTVSSNAVLSILENKPGDIWIGTDWGLNRYQKDNDTFYHYFHEPSNPNSLPHHTIMDIKKDADGDLLIGTLGGFSILNIEKSLYTNYRHESSQKLSLNNDFVNSLLLDSDGNVWIGTERGGVNIYNASQYVFEHFEYGINNENSLSHSTVNSIYEDRENIWVGTAGGGLNRFQKAKGKFLHYQNEINNPNSISSNFVTTIRRNTDGNLWIGTWGHGINVLMNEGSSKEYFQRYHDLNSGIHNNFISSLVEDNDANIWVGSLGGLTRFDHTSGKFEPVFTAHNNTKIKAVGCLIIDDDDHLWIGTQTGLYRIPVNNYLDSKPQVFKHNPKDANSISGDYVISLLQDKLGNIWVGTYGHGINKITVAGEEMKVTRYNSSDGISNSIIYCIEEDKNHNLWLSTDYGLTRFDPDSESSRNFYKINGLLNNQYYWAASYQNQEGKLYFGGMNGMDAFFPDQIKDEINHPRVTITDVKLFNESIIPGQEYNGAVALEKNISVASEITLSYKEKNFSVEFSALDFLNSDGITYSYFLEGFDTKWNQVAPPRRFASYTNLVPGKYTFKVLAAGANGVYSKLPTEISINILPPFWKTWWFRVICLFMLASLIFGYIRYRTYSLKAQKSSLEKLVTQRTEEINQQKEALSYQAIQLQKSNKTLEHNQKLIEGQNKQLEDKNREILSQRDEVIELNEKLNLISQLKLSFFTNISHEFRTPLTLIIGPLERLLGNNDLKEEAKATLEVINRNAQRLLHLINEIMEFRKIEKGKIDLKVTQGNLTQFCHSIFKAFEALSEIKKIKFTFSAGPELAGVWFDSEKIENILYNLLSNAFKYTPNGGNVKMEMQLLTLENSGLKPSGLIKGLQEIISIKIIDSGVGISQENLPLIFKRFYRIESENAFKIGGSGIGLAIAEELIKIHHGEIFVRSEPGKGSVFEIQFPNLQRHHGSSESNRGEMDERNLQSQIEILKNELLVHENDTGDFKNPVLQRDRVGKNGVLNMEKECLINDCFVERRTARFLIPFYRNVGPPWKREVPARWC